MAALTLQKIGEIVFLSFLALQILVFIALIVLTVILRRMIQSVRTNVPVVGSQINAEPVRGQQINALANRAEMRALQQQIHEIKAVMVRVNEDIACNTKINTLQRSQLMFISSQINQITQALTEKNMKVAETEKELAALSSNTTPRKLLHQIKTESHAYLDIREVVSTSSEDVDGGSPRRLTFAQVDNHSPISSRGSERH